MSARADRPFAGSPEEDHLSGVDNDGRRHAIHPMVSRGRFWRLRVAMGAALVATFLALPWLTACGRPAFLLDVPAQRFTVFGATLHPTDNLVLLAFGACVVATVFIGTTLLGRVWCGYGCPQTVYLELVFRPIEAWIEGPAGTRRRSETRPWTPRRVALRGARLAITAALCALLAATFIAYFAGVDGVLTAVGNPGAHPGTSAAIALVTLLAVLDLAFLREQTCTTACPYGRLQAVLFDADTLVVGYDGTRGEPRAHLRTPETGGKPGDCIDCRACVTTCPTGIDIRRGLQLECIGCAQCVDACDRVMDRVKRPRGLVRYTSERDLAGGGLRVLRPRVGVYSVVLAAVYGLFLFVLVGRAPAAVAVLRGSGEPFHSLPGARVANAVRLRFTNHLDREQAFTVSLLAPEGAELAGAGSGTRVAPHQIETAPGAINAPRSAFVRGRATARFRIESDGGLAEEQDLVILGPEGPAE